VCCFLLQNRALQACYFVLGMGLNAAANSIWQCMDYMNTVYKVGVPHCVTAS
jgi:hypothetical protein